MKRTLLAPQGFYSGHYYQQAQETGYSSQWPTFKQWELTAPKGTEVRVVCRLLEGDGNLNRSMVAIRKNGKTLFSYAFNSDLD